MDSKNRTIPRMLVLDLDDTLLRSDLSVSHRARSAVKRTEALGVIPVLASGRVPEAMDHISRLLGLHKRHGYLVSNNGALIQESNTGTIVHEAAIERHAAIAVCDFAEAEGFALQMYDDGIIYVSRQNEYSSIDQSVTGLRQVVVENFRAMAGENCRKLIIPGDPALLKPLESLIRVYLQEEVTLFTSRPYFLEVMPRATDKGKALEKLSKITGVKAEEVLAIGDSMNDEPMIRWAGIGVAMVNGDERVKSIADLVTDSSNNEDGAAEIIEEYFFGKVKNVF